MVGRFWFHRSVGIAIRSVGIAIPNDALIATNTPGRLSHSPELRAVCTPELGFERNRSFLTWRFKCASAVRVNNAKLLHRFHAARWSRDLRLTQLYQFRSS